MSSKDNPFLYRDRVISSSFSLLSLRSSKLFKDKVPFLVLGILITIEFLERWLNALP